MLGSKTGPNPLSCVSRAIERRLYGCAAGAGRRFVQTPSVERHLRNLARAVLLRRHPILLQGPTSSGKTSLVAYLAAQTGHQFVRINNHQQTDLQASWFHRAHVFRHTACKARDLGNSLVRSCFSTPASHRTPWFVIILGLLDSARRPRVNNLLMAARSIWAATSRTRPGGSCSGRVHW